MPLMNMKNLKSNTKKQSALLLTSVHGGVKSSVLGRRERFKKYTRGTGDRPFSSSLFQMWTPSVGSAIWLSKNFVRSLVCFRLKWFFDCDLYHLYTK